MTACGGVTVFLPNSHKERNQSYGQKNAKTLEPCGGDQSDGFQGFWPFNTTPVKSAPHSAGQPRLGPCGHGRPWLTPACHIFCKTTRKAKNLPGSADASTHALQNIRRRQKKVRPTQSILSPPPDRSPSPGAVTGLAACRFSLRLIHQSHTRSLFLF